MARRVSAAGPAFSAYNLDQMTEEMKIPSFPPLSQRASTHLDLIRGLAAVAVAANHLRNLFFINFPQLEHKTAPIAVLYAFSALGHQCVMVFFVLSGYFVSVSVLKFRTLAAWSVQAYAINRLARLYVVLIPALVVTAACDFAARQLPFGNLYFNHPVPNFVVVVFAAEDHLKQFFASLFFLQTILSRPFGSNGALWSLANEFWYYTIGPLLFVAIASKSHTQRLIAASAASILLTVLPGPMSRGFVIWLLGVAVALAAPYSSEIPTWIRGRVVSFVVAGAFIAAALAARRFWTDSEFVGDLLVGTVFAVLLFVIVYSARTKQPGRLYSQMAHGLASFSFSLYAIHFPILVLLRTALGKYGLWSADAIHISFGAMLLVSVVAVAWAFSRVTEAYTASVRESLNVVVGSVLGRWTHPRTKLRRTEV